MGGRDRIDVWPYRDKVDAGHIEVGAILEGVPQLPLGKQWRLWFRIPTNHAAAIADHADSLLIALVFVAMQQARPMVVHGTVSPSLLSNLVQFQAAWERWKPSDYSAVEISADREAELAVPIGPRMALAAYSGGLDSSFTVYRHARRLAGRWNRPLGGGLLVHGFDIPLQKEPAFARYHERAQRSLGSLGLGCLVVATNFRSLPLPWRDCYGAAVAACLALFAGAFSSGLMASSRPYEALYFPLGANPVTDLLLSSDGFAIVHDGCDFSRTEKAAVVAGWPEGLANLRVCWEGNESDRNCGHCEKCLRTKMNFLAAGSGIPESLGDGIDIAEIAAIRLVSEVQRLELEQIVSQALVRGLNDPWVEALQARLAKEAGNHSSAGRQTRSVKQRLLRSNVLRPLLSVYRRWRNERLL